MLDEIEISGETFKRATEPLALLGLLRRHLDQTLPDSIKLSSEQLLTLKSWLLSLAENMKPGKAMWLEETADGKMTKLVAAIGKTETGESIVWHEPLPWPFKFGGESYKIE